MTSVSITYQAYDGALTYQDVGGATFAGWLDVAQMLSFDVGASTAINAAAGRSSVGSQGSPMRSVCTGAAVKREARAAGEIDDLVEHCNTWTRLLRTRVGTTLQVNGMGVGSHSLRIQLLGR
mgnify:CR=1 FL=1